MKNEEALKWLFDLESFGVKLGLKNIQTLLQKLDNPQDALHIIHVAGTNGKGSVCRYIASILQHNGYSVGLYTSPHLIDINERFVINATQITSDELTRYCSQIETLLHSIDDETFTPTFFEVCTAISFLWFKEKKVDFAVIEVGLGGRLDATNVVHPILSIITNISFDHQHVLGETLRKIAIEKAGIIKQNTLVLTAAKQDAFTVIKNKAEMLHAPIIQIHHHDVHRLNANLSYQIFHIKTQCSEYEVSTALLGIHQGINIAISISAIEQLRMKGFTISDEAIKEGIQNTVHPGRMQVMQQKPLILVDGAHNIAAINVLKKTLQEIKGYKSHICVFGAMHDKDIKHMLSILVPITDIFIFTQPALKRAEDPNKIAMIFKSNHPLKKYEILSNVTDAVARAISLAGPEDLVYITGSLYNAGEAIQFLQNKEYFPEIQPSNH